MTLPALAFSAVSYAYERQAALRDVSIAVAPGEIIALLGPSGCGKSTLLRLGAGLLRAGAGEVRAGERLLDGGDLFVPPEQRHIGMVFQDYALFPHLTVAQNVGFGLDGAQEARVTSLLERVGLARYANAYPHRLSGGEQQRVALARTLAPSPRVVLLDEPFSNLDQGLRRALRRDTAALLRETGTAGVLVTHDPDDALAVADRIAVMRAGRIVQEDTPDVIVRAPRDPFVARFFCEGEEVQGTVRGGRFVGPLGNWATTLADGPALAVIPREALRLGVGNEGVAARLVELRALGRRERVSVQVEGLQAPLTLETAPGVPSQPLRLAVDEAQVMLFAREADQG